MLRKLVSAFLLIAVLFVCLVPNNMSLVRADSDVSVYLYSESDTANEGDILVVNLVMSNAPHLVSFSDFEVVFDNISLTFEKSVISSELPESFSVSITEYEDKLVVSGSDEVTIDALESASLDTDVEIEDTSFVSDNPVIICTLYFRVKPSAYDIVSFNVGGENASYTDSSLTSYPISNGGELNYSDFNTKITSDVSADSRIVDLKVNGNTLVDFSPDKYEYVLSVAKEVNELDITTVPGNSFASIDVSSAELAFGENVINIVVTAQDGISTSTYKLIVNRQSSFLQEGANFVDNKGKIFSFLIPPEGIAVPVGFVESTITINGYEVNCYRCEGIRQVLIYAFDGESNPGLYFYDESQNITTAFSPSRSIIRRSSILTIVDVSDASVIPEGFIPTTFIFGGGEYPGYVNASGEIICYMKNEAGKKTFYSYDSVSQIFIKYKPVDKTVERTYKILFNICLGIAIFEAMVIVFIVYVVRRFRKERTNPRPRRV